MDDDEALDAPASTLEELLSVDLLAATLESLPARDLGAASCACQRWAETLSHPAAWRQAGRAEGLIWAETEAEAEARATAQGGWKQMLRNERALEKRWVHYGLQPRVIAQGHDHWVPSILMEPRSRQLVTCSYDGTIRFWSDVDSPEPRCFKLLHGTPPTHVRVRARVGARVGARAQDTSTVPSPVQAPRARASLPSPCLRGAATRAAIGAPPTTAPAHRASPQAPSSAALTLTLTLTLTLPLTLTLTLTLTRLAAGSELGSVHVWEVWPHTLPLTLPLTATLPLTLPLPLSLTLTLTLPLRLPLTLTLTLTQP